MSLQHQVEQNWYSAAFVGFLLESCRSLRRLDFQRKHAIVCIKMVYWSNLKLTFKTIISIKTGLVLLFAFGGNIPHSILF